jgi:hypothetical protein
MLDQAVYAPFSRDLRVQSFKIRWLVSDRARMVLAHDVRRMRTGALFVPKAKMGGS